MTTGRQITHHPRRHHSNHHRHSILTIRPSSHILASSFSDKSLERNVTRQGPNHVHATSISYLEYPSIGQTRNEMDPNFPSHLDLGLPRWVPKGAKNGLIIVNDENCLAIEILGCIQGIISHRTICNYRESTLLMLITS